MESKKEIESQIHTFRAQLKENANTNRNIFEQISNHTEKKLKLEAERSKLMDIKISINQELQRWETLCASLTDKKQREIDLSNEENTIEQDNELIKKIKAITIEKSVILRSYTDKLLNGELLLNQSISFAIEKERLLQNISLKEEEIREKQQEQSALRAQIEKGKFMQIISIQSIICSNKRIQRSTSICLGTPEKN